MKIIVVGGTGTIGAAVVKELSLIHEVVIASRSGGDVVCDITSEDSIRSCFKKVGEFDAVVATVGHVHFEDFASMTPAKYQIGLKDKLMGQVGLVLVGSEFIKDRGSFTLTSGVLNRDPIRAGSSAAMVNGAIEGFIKCAAIELPRGLRINAISPTIVAESMELFAAHFRGFNPVPATKVALAYSKSVNGLQTGQVYQVL